MELSNQESYELEHYLQSHMHPDIAPLVRRAIRLDVFTSAGFLAASDIIQRNHEALDDQLASQGLVDLSENR